MTPEQRARKNQADRDRRARLAAAKPAPGTPKPPRVPVHVATAPPKPVHVKGVAMPNPTSKVPKARKPGSGGVREGAGRHEATDKMVVASFRCSQAQHDKFRLLGGGEWARARIDAGTVKTPK